MYSVPGPRQLGIQIMWVSRAKGGGKVVLTDKELETLPWPGGPPRRPGIRTPPPGFPFRAVRPGATSDQNIKADPAMATRALREA